MSRSGPDNPPASGQPPDDQPAGCSPPLLVMLLALALVIAALVLALNVFGVVSALVFPADPPLPDGLARVEHQRRAHGLDEWTYESTTLNPCAAAAFFRDEGGTCVVDDALCSDLTYHSPGHSVEVIAECQHTGPFSAFGLRWQVVIGTRYSRSATIRDTTVLHIIREILWGGLPPATSTPPPGP